MYDALQQWYIVDVTESDVESIFVIEAMKSNIGPLANAKKKTWDLIKLAWDELNSQYLCERM